MEPAEFSLKVEELQRQIDHGVESLEGLVDETVVGVILPDGVPSVWADKIPLILTREQRDYMAAMIPDTKTGWLAGFKTRLASTV